MGKINDQAKKQYFEKVKEYKHNLDAIRAEEKKILAEIQKNPADGAFKKLTLVEENLCLTSYYILLNELSLALLSIKNENYLNEARKLCYKAIIYLEEVVTGEIDVAYADIRDRLDRIEGFDDAKRYFLVRKLGFAIQSVVEGFGANSKWKWTFVELEGRFATVTKNLLNLKALAAGMDPRVEGYESRMGHLNLTKELLQKAADRYREKYELSTLRLDDFKLAISYLAAIRRLQILLGETENVEITRKKIEVWTQKMDADDKRLEEKRSPQRGGGDGRG